MISTPNPFEKVLYHESPNDAEVQKASKRRSDELFATRLYIVCGLLVGMALLYLLPLLGIVAFAASILWMRFYRADQVAAKSGRLYLVTSIRIEGPELPRGGIPVSQIRSVVSVRSDHAAGFFKIVLKDGTKFKLIARRVGDQDAFWKAIRLVAPHSSGLEFVDGGWVQVRSMPRFGE